MWSIASLRVHQQTAKLLDNAWIAETGRASTRKFAVGPAAQQIAQTTQNTNISRGNPAKAGNQKVYFERRKHKCIIFFFFLFFYFFFRTKTQFCPFEFDQPQDVDIKSYSLVYWEDQASAINHLIHKEGHLLYFHKSSITGSLNTAEWKKAYFVLKFASLLFYFILENRWWIFILNKK